MKTKLMPLAALSLFLAALALPAVAQTPLSTAFTYQGELNQAGAPLDGTADFQFRLFGAVSGGTQIGTTQAVNNVTIVDGLFTASLNFGVTVFNGDARWLEIAVRSPAGAGAFTTLSPRQPLTATPYALQTRGIFVDGANQVGIGTTAPSALLSLGNSNGDSKLKIWDDGPGTGIGFGVGPAQFRMHLDLPTNRFSFLNSPAGSEVFTVTGGGNIGVGTASPLAKLDVRGDVRLGPSGQYFAPASSENTRIVRGIVDGAGNILQGSGFTASRVDYGRYRITFAIPFPDTPSITVTPHANSIDDDYFAQVYLPGISTTEIWLQAIDQNPPFWRDATFAFCAIGLR